MPLGSIHGRLVVARREFRALSSEKTIVLALLIQLIIAGFSSFLVVGLTALYAPSSVDGGGVTVAVSGNASGEAFEAVGETPGIDGRRYATDRSALEAFQEGSVDAVLVANSVDQRIEITATVPESSLRKTLVVVKVRETLETLERRERTTRARHLESELVPVPPDVDASPYYGFTYTVLVPLLLFLPVFVSGSLAVDALTEEVERGTLDLLRVAPLSLTAIVDGKALTAAVLVPAQAALWLALLSLNGIPVRNLGLLLVLVSGLALAFVALGIGIAGVVPSRQRAQLLYSTGVLVALGLGALLPEHPATTVARLAIGSPTGTTILLAVGYSLLGVVVAIGVRTGVAGMDAERL